MNVSSVCAWLGRDVRHSIATDDVSAPEVTLCESKNNLGPARDAEGSECDFEREVPDHTSVCLLALVSMLRYSTMIPLYSNVELDKMLLCGDLPRLLPILS